ncbi:MAG: hypothetical protein JO166_15155 [Deltaproteobacteria bacterium]|nr:hypothetical protein [Deltaproteobacteria bacterium]
MQGVDTAPPPKAAGEMSKRAGPRTTNAGSSEGSAVRIQRLCPGDHPSHGAITTGVAPARAGMGLIDQGTEGDQKTYKVGQI